MVITTSACSTTSWMVTARSSWKSCRQPLSFILNSNRRIRNISKPRTLSGRFFAQRGFPAAITVFKLAGARIPLAAVGFRHGTGQSMQRWEQFALALARWSQMEDDLFDWHHDLRHRKTSYFLTEANKRKGFDTVDAWVIREGFQLGLETLQRELSALRDLARPLTSPDVASYLDLRETVLEDQKTKISEAFQVLSAVAVVTTAQTPD